MNSEFELLASFLDSFEPEVSGRSAEPVSEADAERIARFASGELAPAERASLAPLLASNDQAMAKLVAALRQEG